MVMVECDGSAAPSSSQLDKSIPPRKLHRTTFPYQAIATGRGHECFWTHSTPIASQFASRRHATRQAASGIGAVVGPTYAAEQLYRWPRVCQRGSCSPVSADTP